MWRGAQMGQKRWNDFSEEESKVKRNLGRLIHTVQHIPSTRSRLDTNSLWTLVGQLESFGPLAASKSIQFTSSEENKSFSRKYLNLRLYPQRKESASVSPGRSKSDKRSQSREVREKKDEAPVTTNNKFKKSRNRHASKYQEESNNVNLPASRKVQEIGDHVTHNHDQRRNFRKKDLIEKDNQTIKNISFSKATQGKVLKKKSKIKLQIDRIQKNVPKNEQVQNHNKAVKNVHASLKRNYSLESLSNNQNVFANTQFETYSKSKQIPLKRVQNQYQVLDKIRKSKNSVVRPSFKNFTSSQFDRNMQPVVCDVVSDVITTAEDSSMVKTLTNYWNNRLTNKLEEESIFGSVGTDIQCCVENLHWSQGNQHNSEVRIKATENLPLGLRHKTESRMDDLLSWQQLRPRYDSPPEKFPKKYSISIYGSSSTSRLVYAPDNTPATSEESVVPSKSEHSFSNSSSLNEVDTQCIVSFAPHIEDDNKNKTNLKYPEICEISANNVVEILQKLINKLKPFSKTFVLSDQITLPQTIKIMLVLITSKILSLREEMFLEDCKSEIIDKNINEATASKFQISCSTQTYKGRFPTEETSQNVQKPFHDNKTVLVSKPKLYKYQLQKEEESINKQNNIVALPIPVISLGKVTNALKYFTLLCNDGLWMSLVFNNPTFGHVLLDESDRGLPSATGTYLMFEGRIVIESVIDEESEDCIDHEDGDDDLNVWGRCLKPVLFVAGLIDSFVDFVLDQVIFYWPNSKKDFLKIVYQLSVSFMIWWIILKDIFTK